LVEAGKGIALSELLTRVKGLIERSLPDAVWVRAEISELRGKNGHLYVSLTERNDRGDVLAQIKGVIWKNRADAITARFEQATGGRLKSDIKILCLARVRFDPLYGLDLIVEDVDPSYTLGELAAKLARIREQLEETGLYDLNKRLPSPVEYLRVAVVSPETSAGLGDFRRETDLLQSAGLCDFHYFQATFQGVDAPPSIQAVLLQALTAHKQRAFDVLVVIRGGGAVTDLAWLNDLELAQLLCQSRIPVYTGIGHERDNTILDEIAHRRFDTPSKVALHISATIKDNALGAIQAWERINALVGRIVLRERTIVETQTQRIESGARSTLKRVEADRQAHLRLIHSASSAQVRQASLTLESERRKLLDDAARSLGDAELGITQLTDAIVHRAQLPLAGERAEIDRMADSIVAKSQWAKDTAARDLSQLRAQLGRDSTRAAMRAQEVTELTWDASRGGSTLIVEMARKDIANYARIVVGLGPQSTLQRGFAIARDVQDAPLTSREVAIKHPSFRVQFRDGVVAVDNREYEKGDS
jgi:exodeoxyribonuclease VII large subunit